MKKIAISLVCLTAMLLLCACGGRGAKTTATTTPLPTPTERESISLSALLDGVISSAVPAERTLTELLAPGTPTPVEYLPRASGAFCSRLFTVTVDGATGMWEPVFMLDTESGEMLLFVGRYEEQAIIVRLSTSYTDLRALCEGYDGTVTGVTREVVYAHFFDFLYPSNAVSGMMSQEATGNAYASRICYGRLTADGVTAVSAESVAESERTSFAAYADAIDRVTERFGITLGSS